MNRRLRKFLRSRGASDDDILHAEREGWLTLLAFDKLFMPGTVRYTFDEAATRAGFETTQAERIWRALGFPSPPEGQAVFTNRDVDALTSVARIPSDSIMFVGTDEAVLDELVQQVRVIGGALAKIAEVQSDNILRAVRAAEDAGLGDEDIAINVSQVDFGRVEELLSYALRLQLRATTWRRLASGPDGASVETAVGFVDLVGYTALSQELDTHELAALVDRFEELAYDTVAEYGGRVVKTIGDEVMFVAGDVHSAARISLRLTERSAVDELLPEARAGLAYGDILAHEGDYYGPVVNLARRLVDLAKPGTVVCSEALYDALDGDPAFTWRKLRQRRLRDIGSVQIWHLQAVDDTVEIPVVKA